MSNTVKMYTLIEGEATCIGQCHAGQARLLRKKGLAEWKDGKLWLSSPANTSTVHITLPSEASVDAVMGVMQGVSAKFAAVKEVPETVEVSTLSHNDINVDSLTAVCCEAGIAPLHFPDILELAKRTHREVQVVSVLGMPELLGGFQFRLALGHDMAAYDDPKARRIGFIDYDKNEYVYSSLSNLKLYPLTESDAEAFGVPLDTLRTLFFSASGRASIFGGTEYYEWGSGCEEELPETGMWTTAPDVSAVFNPTIPVGRGCPHPVKLDPLREGESMQERLVRIREEAKANPPLKSVYGWTRFTAPGAHPAIPVYQNGAQHPAPENEWAGYFKRAHDRLYRVWARGRDAGWDESLLQEDDTYRVIIEHTLPGLPAREHIEECFRLVDLHIEAGAVSKAAHEISPGWTKFEKYEDCPAVFFMDVPPDLSKELRKNPYEPMTEEEKAALVAQMVRTPSRKLHAAPVSGFYQIVRNRMFRVLSSNGSSTWDESVRAPDGTYDLYGSGRAIERIHSVGRHDLLVPGGFPETLDAVERRIAVYLASPEGAWDVTYHD